MNDFLYIYIVRKNLPHKTLRIRCAKYTHRMKKKKKKMMIMMMMMKRKSPIVEAIYLGLEHL